MQEPEHISAPQLWIVLSRAYAAIAHYAERSIAAQGLGLTDFMVLEVLIHKGPLTISAIGSKILLASASMTSAIDRVEHLGLVHRLSCATDRRVRYVDLTPAGRKLITKLYAAHQQDLEALAADLSLAERCRLYAGLKKIGLTAKLANIEADSLVKTIQPAPVRTAVTTNNNQRPKKTPAPALTRRSLAATR
jgi:MarR family transcriptional regulator, 2-MHQ and catechol-resistance regulon repressor